MAESVYLETTIISYLAARQSRDLVIAACQRLTSDWWDGCRPQFDLYVSERVVAEALALTNGYRYPVICTPQELLEE